MFEQNVQVNTSKRKYQARSRWLALSVGGLLFVNVSLLTLVILLVFVMAQQSEANDANTTPFLTISQTSDEAPIEDNALFVPSSTSMVVAQASTSTSMDVNTTPAQTLRPPPTLEPPTATILPSQTPTPTVIPTLNNGSESLNINGLETATATQDACVPEESWELRYEVQANDALANIASQYSTTVQQLVDANCLVDSNLIRIGQQLRVPGTAHPQTPEYTCIPYELLSPVNNAYTIPGSGELSFSWLGPRAPLYLIRIIQPDGRQFERLIELRQNEAIDLSQDLRQSGQHTWYVYPLGRDYLQIPCAEGGPWTFFKAPPPTDTPELGDGAEDS